VSGVGPSSDEPVLKVMADREYARLQNCCVNNRAIPRRTCSRLWMLSRSIGYCRNRCSCQELCTAVRRRRCGTTRATLRLASILPYQTINLQKAKLAMKIGGEYRLRNIRLRHWQRFATDLRLDEGWLIERIRTMAASVPDHATSIRNELEADGLSQMTMTRLVQRLKARAASCMRLVQCLKR
jgi:hypothetical protein